MAVCMAMENWMPHDTVSRLSTNGQGLLLKYLDAHSAMLIAVDFQAPPTDKPDQAQPPGAALVDRLLEPDISEDEAESDIQKADQVWEMQGGFILVAEVLPLLDEVVRREEDWDPYVRAITRSTVASLKAHSRAMGLMVEVRLWVPLLCELRAFVEAAAALAKLWQSPDEAGHAALARKRVSIASRMREVGCHAAYQGLYGPLSNVIHNGISAMTCQTRTFDSSLEDPLPDIHPDGDHHLVQIDLPGMASEGLLMVFQPIPDESAAVRYLPLTATVCADAVLWLAGTLGVRGGAVSVLEAWLEKSGSASMRFFTCADAAAGSPSTGGASTDG